jgi:3-isopropylmalate/(R)-2-methylmalate dehydratase small subunit
MKQFTQCIGTAGVIARNNVDTDLIIRIERMSQLKRGQFKPWAFESLKYLPDGSEDPEFILNREPFRNAKVLVSGANFGCGSSREMAVWALEDLGIRCVIAASFGDIFYNNCFQNGILPIRLASAPLAELTALALTGTLVSVDLATQQIVVDGHAPITFDIEEARRQSLLLGIDDIDRTLAMASDIEAFQQRDRQRRPWIYATTQVTDAHP